MLCSVSISINMVSTRVACYCR